MTIQEVIDKIMSFSDDVILNYNGHGEIFINPWNIHKFELGYKNITKTYSSIDELINDPIYDGKTLIDISLNLEII